MGENICSTYRVKCYSEYIQNSYNWRPTTQFLNGQKIGIDRHFTQKIIIMANKHMKRYSVLVIRKHLLTTWYMMKYYFMSTRMANIKHIDKIIWWEFRTTGLAWPGKPLAWTSHALYVEVQKWYHQFRKFWQFLKN